MKSEARVIASALASAVTFAVIPLVTSVALVAYNLFVVGSIDPKFSPWGAFGLARDVLIGIWFLNGASFIVTSAALRLFGGPHVTVVSAALAGLLLAGVVLADLRLPFPAWFAAGPLGAALAATLHRLLGTRQATPSRRVHPNEQAQRIDGQP